MVWTTIPDGDIDPESPIDAPLMAALRDNPIAIAGGLAGAPKVQNAALAGLPWTSAQLGTNSVGQAQIANTSVGIGELKYSSGAVSLTTVGATKLVLPGGNFGFYPLTQFSRAAGVDSGNFLYSINASNYTADSTDALVGVNKSIGGGVPEWDSYIAYIGMWLVARNYGDTYMHAYQYFVTASPPYDLGDGAVPLFAFAELAPSGEIRAVYTSDTPPWAYNGPTSIVPDRRDHRTGIGYKRIHVAPAILDLADDQAALVAAAKADIRARVQAGRLSAPAEIERTLLEIPIDAAWKNADMDLIPHPFRSGWDDSTIVLLDPMSPVVQRMAELGQQGENLTELLVDWMTIDNTAVARHAPPGVMPVGCALRNTRRAL